MTSRKQKTLRINSVSADITRVPRPPKSTHHHEWKPKSELRVKNLTTLEKPPKGIIARKKKYTWKKFSVHKYIDDLVRRLDLKKIPVKAGFPF